MLNCRATHTHTHTAAGLLPECEVSELLTDPAGSEFMSAAIASPLELIRGALANQNSALHSNKHTYSSSNLSRWLATSS